MRRLFPTGFLVLPIVMAAVLASSLAGAAEPAFSEYEVKAGFIYNIAKFVEWPERTDAGSRNQLLVCVLGSDPFGKAFEQIEGRTVQGKKLGIRRVASAREARECHILFIGRSEKDRVARITETVKDWSILTVGDTEGYLREGVMVNFYMEDGKVRFEIDVERTKQSKLSLSSHLLKLARIVRGSQ